MNKKILYGFVAGALFLPLSACANGDNAEQSNHTNQSSQKTNNDTTNDKKDPQKGDQTQSNHNKNKKDTKTASTSKDGIVVVSNPKSHLVLVNKTHKLPDGYTPPDLTIPDVPFPYDGTYEKMHLRKVAADALENLFRAAQKDGIILYAQSGYRSYERQVTIFNNNVKTQGEKKASAVSAHPGTSEHQTGLAMDISSSDVGYQLIQDFGDTEEGRWVKDHCADYGFIIRYPKGKESITGYEYEPWHLRYVGKKAASYIQTHHITLEEYIAKQKG
ncbi:M15 family metallopeptidase [Scopulibacillus darangshiensis]|nr:M15 family metallopeptidase [Scopulibacillus darangshiensis]